MRAGKESKIIKKRESEEKKGYGATIPQSGIRSDLVGQKVNRDLEVLEQINEVVNARLKTNPNVYRYERVEEILHHNQYGKQEASQVEYGIL